MSDMNLLFSLSSLLNLQFLSIFILTPFFEDFLIGRSPIFPLHSFPSLQKVELILSFDYIFDISWKYKGPSFKNSHLSVGLFRLFREFNDLTTIKSIALRIDRGKVSDDGGENTDAQLHVDFLLNTIVKNSKLKGFSFPMHQDWPIRLDSIEIISNSNSIEVLEFPKLLGRKKLNLLTKMKSLKILRIQLSDYQKSFQFDSDSEDLFWHSEDNQLIIEFLNSKEKTKIHREKVKEAIKKFVKSFLPNVFFALYFKDEWIN